MYLKIWKKLVYSDQNCFIILSFLRSTLWC